MTSFRFILLLPLLSVISGGCQYSPDYGDKILTPNGYTFYWNNQGSHPAYYSVEELAILFDEAVEKTVAHLGQYVGGEEEMVRAVIRSYIIIAIDHPRFSVNGSPTGYASGVWYAPGYPITVAFWSRAMGNEVPADAPPWTVYSWPTRPDPAYDWGVPPHFPALGHEIGHAIWGGAFEHGWTPPLR